MASLFSKPKTPAIQPPTPLPDEQQLSRARKRTVSQAAKGSGYQSTILSTGGAETLGP